MYRLVVLDPSVRGFAEGKVLEHGEQVCKCISASQQWKPEVGIIWVSPWLHRRFPVSIRWLDPCKIRKILFEKLPTTTKHYLNPSPSLDVSTHRPQPKKTMLRQPHASPTPSHEQRKQAEVLLPWYNEHFFEGIR